MIQHSVDVTINRPVDQVFQFLTDPRNHPRWDKLSVEMEQQDNGPWQAGTKFREVRKFGGRNVEVSSQVESITPNRQFDIQSLTGPSFHGHWVFEPVDGNTHLHYEAQLKPAGFMRLIEPLIRGQFRKQLDENFANLKRVLEQGS